MDFFDSFRGLVGDSSSFFSDAFDIVSSVAGKLDNDGGRQAINNIAGNTGSSQDLASIEKMLNKGFIEVSKPKSEAVQTGDKKGSVDIAQLESEWYERMIQFAESEDL